MALLVEGIKVGLILCLMVGPLFFALIQTGVEEGFRAGLMVGFGIWVSDFLYAVGVYKGMSYFARVMAGEQFSMAIGIGGSGLLTIFGLVALLTVPRNLYSADPALARRQERISSNLSLWLKGFLINTVNPFTVFFWMGLMSTVIIKDSLKENGAAFFFGGILGTVIFGDVLKILLAKKIRAFMQPVHLLWLRRISGVALIVFGAALLFRVLI